MTLHEKNLERRLHARILLGVFVFVVVCTFCAIFFGKMTNESWLAIGAILGYLGNNTYQNYKTSPKGE